MSSPTVPAKTTTLRVPKPTQAELVQAYRVGVRSRAAEERIVRLVTRGEVKFAIWGPGEEIHGTATALALSRVVDPSRFGIVPHYRSGSLCSMWSTLHGNEDFTLAMLRQQFSRGTDEISGGRQMVYHLHMPELGILPVQSPVGMQLGKAAGYALGFKKRGIHDSVCVAVVGDGTTAEGDLHDAMNAASVWKLPLLILVTDNSVAISTTPDEGRGIVDFKAYAEGFGLRHASCDGRDFMDVYNTTYRVAKTMQDEQRGCILHVKDLPRFNGHSSAADVTFDLGQDDPLMSFGAMLVEKGHLKQDQILRRIEGEGRDFYAHHELGSVMTEEDTKVGAIIEQVKAEPHPDPSTLFDHMYAPFPEIEETPTTGEPTCVSYAGAIRSALDKLIIRNDGLICGQDVGRLGGVMTATAGLKKKHPERVIDAPLNEPLIVGTSCGYSLHDGVMALPEIQFGDYSLNAFHWLVYLGTLSWSTLGRARSQLLLRMPSDPFGGGAMYHSMSLDGYFCSIPGLVVIMPSTSFDVHGLLLSAGQYEGPVVCLEPKWMYRQSLGPALPGEPTTRDAITALKKATMGGEIPEIEDVYVPFGKAACRREGSDVTLVAWGRAVWTSMAAADQLAAKGISVEVLDLRTLVPPDMDAVMASVEKTGRLIVAAEDRAFGGFVRQIQGDVVQRRPGTPTRALGQKQVPGIGQSSVLEAATILTADDIVHAADDLMEARSSGPRTTGWVSSHYFV
jgi:2-oxoisovalerate dehydrogenase E1 component